MRAPCYHLHSSHLEAPNHNVLRGTPHGVCIATPVGCISVLLRLAEENNYADYYNGWAVHYKPGSGTAISADRLNNGWRLEAIIPF